MTAIGTAVARALDVVRNGGLVGIPTETVYGLAADAGNAAAVARIFAAKGRPTDHPLIVHVASAEELPRWAEAVSAVAATSMSMFLNVCRTVTSQDCTPPFQGVSCGARCETLVSL